MARSQAAKLDVIRLKREHDAKPAMKARRVPSARKLVIRLLPLIDEHRRSIMRYRGDLTTMIVEAIGSVDLRSVLLVELAGEAPLRTTTIGLPPSLHKDLKAIAKTKRASMNVLVNTALAHWLAAKRVIRLV
ncbi:MAG TPA: hypothetical protein VE398_19720 [Acidobacteriota bacterium]|nr:hypothetical protein [Acidobacteriota bacterium]